MCKKWHWYIFYLFFLFFYWTRRQVHLACLSFFFHFSYWFDDNYNKCTCCSCRSNETLSIKNSGTMLSLSLSLSLSTLLPRADFLLLFSWHFSLNNGTLTSGERERKRKQSFTINSSTLMYNCALAGWWWQK